MQSFPYDTLLSYACANVDTGALQIESAICPRFRGYKSTNECMRGSLGASREQLLLLVNISIEKCGMWGDVRHGEGVYRLAHRAWGVYSNARDLL